MATLAAMLKRKGHDVRGSDQDVYPPMSDFLALGRHSARSPATRAEHITGDLDLVVVGNAISRGNAGARGGARSQDPLLLAAGGDPRALPLGRAVDRDRRHARQDDDDVADRLAADARRRRSERAGRRHRAQFRRARIQLPHRAGPRLRDRRRRIRQRVLRQDGEVPEVPARHRRDQQRRVRPRRHLRRLRRGDAGVPPPRQPRAAPRPAARRRRQPRRARRCAARRCRACRRSAPATTSTGRRTICEPAGASTRFKVRRGGSPFGVFEVPLVGAYNVRNATAAIAVATEVGISAERIAEGLRAFAGVKRRLEIVGVADGVTVYDDFAHHPTAVAETLAGLRASNPDARIWAVFEPRSASSCRRVFQDDFARAFAGADEVLIAPVFRSTLPESERLSIPQLVRDLDAQGLSAREAESIDDIVASIVRGASAGRSRRADVERRLRRHPPEAAAGAGVSAYRIVPAGDSALDRRVRGADRSRRQRADDCLRRRDSGGAASPASATSCRPTGRSRSTSIRCGPTATR